MNNNNNLYQIEFQLLILYIQLLCYVATISNIARFYNVYFLGQINESFCLSVCLSVCPIPSKSSLEKDFLYLNDGRARLQDSSTLTIPSQNIMKWKN